MARVCKFLQWIDPTSLRLCWCCEPGSPIVADHRVFVRAGMITSQKWLYISDYLWLLYYLQDVLFWNVHPQFCTKTHPSPKCIYRHQPLWGGAKEHDA